MGAGRWSALTSTNAFHLKSIKLQAFNRLECFARDALQVTVHADGGTHHALNLLLALGSPECRLGHVLCQTRFVGQLLFKLLTGGRNEWCGQRLGQLDFAVASGAGDGQSIWGKCPSVAGDFPQNSQLLNLNK